MIWRTCLARSLALVVLAAAGPGLADGPVSMTDDGLAIGGYDPVAYHRLGEALPGDTDLSYPWRGAEWRFVSEAHRALFAADPGAYEPAFGGFCAYRLTRGEIVAGDPERWQIIDGTLYLNADETGASLWQEDVEGNAFIAESLWLEELEVGQ